jgi:hypothetical protein
VEWANNAKDRFSTVKLTLEIHFSLSATVSILRCCRSLNVGTSNPTFRSQSALHVGLSGFRCYRNEDIPGFRGSGNS